MANPFKSLAETNNEIYPESYTVSFAAAGTRGSVVALGYRTPIRLLIGTGWVSTAVQVRPYRSEDGTTYRPVYDQYGSAVTISAVAGRDVELAADSIKRTAYLRLLGTQATGTVAAQATACTVTVIAALV